MPAAQNILPIPEGPDYLGAREMIIKVNGWMDHASDTWPGLKEKLRQTFDDVMLGTVGHVFAKYPLTRGMAAYAVIWPIGSCIQQKISGQKEIDFKRAARFCLYGSLYVAPTLYIWVRISSKIWPHTNFKSAIRKALIEQVTYGPAAITSFFFGMTLLEGRGIQKGIEEVKKKFIPTYKVGVCVWPILQTINFSLVPEKNRVIFVGFCSLMWTSLLAYMKYHEEHEEHKPIENS